MALEAYSKDQKKRLRDLAGQAYETELNRELARLLEDFQSWQAGDLNPFELSEKIHQFHQGASKELYKRYTYVDADIVVARALAEGVLEDKDLPAELLEPLAGQRAFFKTEP